MWILYVLFLTGLHEKIALCDCNDHLLGRFNIKTVKLGKENQRLTPSEDFENLTSPRKRKNYAIRILLVGDDDERALEVFRNGAPTSTHHFEIPIIAQYVRTIPRRQKKDDSVEIEFYGCNYESVSYYLNGSSLVRWTLKNTPISSPKDFVKFRFKTFEANGVIIFGRGLQNDRFGLVLKDGGLLLTMNLGTNNPTNLSVGSALDDGVWHDVVVNRTLNIITLSVDRVSITGYIPGDFTMLDLDHVLFIGGVHEKQADLTIFQNYSGCIDDLFVSWIDVNERMQKMNNIERDCLDSDFTPLTFLNRKSFMKFVGLDRVDYYHAYFEFRTYEESGLLLYHEFLNNGYLKVSLDDGKLWTHLLTESSHLIAIQNYEKTLNDGRWHYLDVSLRTNNLTMVIDGNPIVTVRLIKILSGAFTFLGGHNVLHVGGFIGCMRKIFINKYYKDPGNWQPNEEYCCENDIVFNSCKMVDRCHPNPCEHEGVCQQTAFDFFCDCSNTGYGGALCHKALLPMNCHAHGLRRNKLEYREAIQIDIDGSGPLPNFPVTCYFNSRGQTITILHHENEATTTVDGFQDAGSYEQTITYLANDDQIAALTRQSTKCWQNIRYECFRSRLLNSPSSEGNFNPFSWWVSHYNQKMDFWGGAVEGSRMCECGMLAQCKNNTKWCNCDAEYYEWRSDGGDIVGKEYLPVKQLRFGDTGSLVDDKKGKYTLGPLYCEGNEIFSNVITLRRKDVSIRLEMPNLKNTFDFYFEFKTGQSNGVIVECRGPIDRLMIALEGGNAIRFMYQVDGDRFDIFAQHSSSLSDNEWHTVYIEVNRKELLVMIDGNEKNLVRDPNELLMDVELYSPSSIGGTIESSSSNGFVGCLRAFLINGELIDLVYYVRENPYGLSVGCVGKCISNPCLNNGTCIDYYDSYACDCRWTSFKGPICADEIGASFNGQNGVIYEFPSHRLSTISERIRLGFSTTHPQGSLLGLYSSISKEYMTVSVTNSGHIRIVFDFGFERQEVIYSRKHFDRGQFHDLRISRSSSGSVLKLQVDDYEPMEIHFNVKISADAQFDNVQYLYVGKNETANEGFIGCVSRVEFNDIYPLKLLFQQNPPDNILSSGEVHEDFCGVESVTHGPEATEIKEGSTCVYPDINNTRKLVVVLSGLILSFVGLIFLFGMYIGNRRAFYHTQEQFGTESATDADTAVIHSKTGHVVFKKKEWFI